LAGIGQRWLEVERAMGIEYIAKTKSADQNQWVAAADSPACDFRVKNDVIAANPSQCSRRLSQATDIQSTLARRAST
jgi:hypothetical protein